MLPPCGVIVENKPRSGLGLYHSSLLGLSVEEEVRSSPSRIAKSPAAIQAFSKLTNAGVKADLLNDALRTVYAFRKSSDQQRKPARHWATLAGMSLPTLKRFPLKLRAVAKQIEALNRHPYFLPQLWVSYRFGRASEDRRKEIVREFSSLPDILREYAIYIERQPADVGRFRRSTAGRSNKYEIGAVLAILVMNKYTVKRPCYREVADILTALDPTNKADERWTESRLEKMYRDNITKPLKASRRK